MPKLHPLETIQTLLREDTPWNVAYPIIAEQVRALLDDSADLIEDYGRCQFTTAEIAEMLWPAHYRKAGRDEKAITRLFRALQAIAKHELSAWVSRAAPKHIYGRTVQSLVWAKPAASDLPASQPYALRSPEHALVQRMAALDADSLEIDPFAVLPEILALIADARKLAGTLTT